MELPPLSRIHNWGFGFPDHSIMIEQLICGIIEKGVRV
jgi:hypothetical protein